MSTSPAPRTLFRRWIDDAAVFPPGNAPVPQAWTDHLALRAGGYGDLLGPLLVGTSGAAALADAALADAALAEAVSTTGDGASPVDVGVIARAGTDVAELVDAVATLRGRELLQVVSVEVAHDGGGRWRRALELGVPVAVEVPRGVADEARERALDEVARAAAGPVPVLAKLRTQATATDPVPTAGELAGFLLAVRARDLAFKLTGGLHHAVARTVTAADGTTEEQHGALNVLVATHRLEKGAALPELGATLAVRDAEALASLARGLDEDAVGALRARFVSFGCCGVLDPVCDLVDLGLLTP